MIKRKQSRKCLLYVQSCLALVLVSFIIYYKKRLKVMELKWAETACLDY